MVIHKYSHVVCIADGALCDPRPRPLPVDVDTRSTEGGVGEVTVMDGNLTLFGNTETVLSDIRSVFRGIKLCSERVVLLIVVHQ